MGTLGVLVLLVVALGMLLIDGVYQVLTGRPAINPLERRFLKKVPATDLDCVRQGACKLLQAMGLTFLIGPSSIMAVQNTAFLTGILTRTPGRPPAVLDALIFVGIFGSLAVGLFLIIAAYTVSTRIKYVPIGITGPQPDS